MLVVVGVLAVIGGVLWLLPAASAPRSAAGTGTPTTPSTTAPSPVTSPPLPSPTAAPPTTTSPTSAPTASASPPTTAGTTTAAAPAPAPAPAPGPPVPAALPAPAPAAVADPGVEGAVLTLVNAERSAAGCGAVSGDGGLAGVARAHSADMRDRGYFSHTSPDGRSPFDRAAAAGVSGSRAENIAQGQPDAASVMAAWMASPGHRVNILDCSLTRLGVGVAEGPGGPWWTQLFGS